MKDRQINKEMNKIKETLDRMNKDIRKAINLKQTYDKAKRK